MFVNKRLAGWAGSRYLLPATGFLVSLALGLPSVGQAETLPRPSTRVPLKDLGFPGYPISLLHAGASMTTLHVLDAKHVLFTYSLRSLVPRVPGDNADDTDRQVAAVLVELPSGKVLARSTWRLHDHARYLWSVGQGVFVVRMGNDLSLMAPMAGLQPGGEPLRRYALPHRPGRPVLVTGSPDGKVITVETEQQVAPAMGDEELDGDKRRHFTLEFFRLGVRQGAEDPVHVSGAGAVGSPVLLGLAMDGDGYLWAEDGNRGNWNIDFNEFGGHQQKLTPIMSSCHPRLSLLSRSEFLVETCRGTDDASMLTSYGFDGHENWQEPLGAALQPPTLSLAPVVGRFAMSRLVASSGGAPVSGLGNEDPLSQEIRVYQTESGDMLLHVLCAPAMRSAENFDLSPDGTELVVLGPETLDLYRLPALSAKDRKDLAEVQAMTPPEGNGPVALARITRPIAAPESLAGGSAVQPAEDPSATPQTVAMANATTSSSAGTEPGLKRRSSEVTSPAKTVPNEAGAVGGDPAATAVRKPPTLLNPGEKAEFQIRPAGPS